MSKSNKRWFLIKLSMHCKIQSVFVLSVALVTIFVNGKFDSYNSLYINFMKYNNLIG